MKTILIALSYVLTSFAVNCELGRNSATPHEIIQCFDFNKNLVIDYQEAQSFCASFLKEYKLAYPEIKNQFRTQNKQKSFCLYVLNYDEIPSQNNFSIFHRMKNSEKALSMRVTTEKLKTMSELLKKVNEKFTPLQPYNCSSVELKKSFKVMNGEYFLACFDLNRDDLISYDELRYAYKNYYEKSVQEFAFNEVGSIVSNIVAQSIFQYSLIYGHVPIMGDLMHFFLYKNKKSLFANSQSISSAFKQLRELNQGEGLTTQIESAPIEPQD